MGSVMVMAYSPDNLEPIERALAEGGATAVRIDQPDLEAVFLSLTGRRLRD